MGSSAWFTAGPRVGWVRVLRPTRRSWRTRFVPMHTAGDSCFRSLATDADGGAMRDAGARRVIGHSPLEELVPVVLGGIAGSTASRSRPPTRLRRARSCSCRDAILIAR
jgi:hypothetical protein